MEYVMLNSEIFESFFDVFGSLGSFWSKIVKNQQKSSKNE